MVLYLPLYPLAFIFFLFLIHGSPPILHSITLLHPSHVQEIADAENWKKMKMQILMSAMKKC